MEPTTQNPTPATTPAPVTRCYGCGKAHTAREQDLIERLMGDDGITEAEETELNAMTDANHRNCFQ